MYRTNSLVAAIIAVIIIFVGVVTPVIAQDDYTVERLQFDVYRRSSTGEMRASAEFNLVNNTDETIMLYEVAVDFVDDAGKLVKTMSCQKDLQIPASSRISPCNSYVTALTDEEAEAIADAIPIILTTMANGDAPNPYLDGLENAKLIFDTANSEAELTTTGTMLMQLYVEILNDLRPGPKYQDMHRFVVVTSRSCAILADQYLKGASTSEMGLYREVCAVSRHLIEEPELMTMTIAELLEKMNE